MVIFTGTVAEPLLLVSVTETPVDPAGADRVTVPVEDEPPVTGLGDSVNPLIVPITGPWPAPLGLMVKVPVKTFPDVAVIVAVVVLVTLLVLTGKVALVCPAGTVILVGTVAEPVLLLKVTTTPAGPAGAPSVTVPVEDKPPVTGLGLKVRPVSAPVAAPIPLGVITRGAVLLLFTDVTVMFAVVVTVTGLVSMGNEIDFWPGGIMSIDGTVAAALSL